MRSRSLIFTPREQQVYDLIVFEGLADKEIARRIDLSPSTIKGIVQSVMSKRGASTRTILVVNHYKKQQVPA
jgi:DNA-binding NarL/FixJ family response regulator